MTRRLFPWGLAVILGALVFGGTVRREVVELGDGTGNWNRVTSRLAMPWSPAPVARDHPLATSTTPVRITRWYAYGFAFHHSEHYAGPL